MFVVGLTGGIGSGKSTVSQMFRELGCPVIDADILAREVVEPGKPAWHDISKTFGPGVFHSDGSINREVLGLLIFGDEKKRKLLNSITHPQIQKAMLYRLFIHLIHGEQLVILDMPLLFETETMLPMAESTIVVYCHRDEQIERIRARNGYSEEVAVERIDAQMSLNVKRQKADHVIDNTGDGKTVRRQVSELHVKLRSSNAHWKNRLILLAYLSVFALILLTLLYLLSMFMKLVFAL